MDRLIQLREYMEKERLDAFYIAKPANVRCISGFTGEDSFLFITKANQYFITDARYTEQASYECPDYELVNWRINFGCSMGKAVAYCADKDGVKTIGFEQDHLTFEKWNSMQAELSAEMVPTLNVIEGFRAIKTPEDLKGKKISIQEASTAETALNRDENLKKSFSEIKAYPDLTACFMDLESGRCDAVLADSVLIEYYMTKKPGQFRELEGVVSKDTFSIGIKKDNQALVDLLNDGIAKVVASGEAKKISEKWFGKDVVLK